MLDPGALKTVAHAADRVDETDAGTAAAGHGAGLGLVHERKDLQSFPEGPGPSRS